MPKPLTIITIGTFDGVHIGHQKILNHLVHISKKRELIPTVLTFFPHPRMVLEKDSDIKLLNTIEERTSLLKQNGIDNVEVKAFTKAFSNLEAKDYIKDILVEELNAKIIVIGYDHHFGKNRSANINDLRAFETTFNFEVEEISAQDIANVTVSSTKIREALSEGKIHVANQYLGYYYMLTGIVVKGKGLGKTINFPTANISIKDTYKLIPKDGVYVVQSKIKNFFNFNEDIYDEQLTVQCLKRLRDEQKFASVDALKAQLEVDKMNAQTFIQH